MITIQCQLEENEAIQVTKFFNRVTYNDIYIQEFNEIECYQILYAIEKLRTALFQQGVFIS